jgi:hypothetical protein
MKNASNNAPLFNLAFLRKKVASFEPDTSDRNTHLSEISGCKLVTIKLISFSDETCCTILYSRNMDKEIENNNCTLQFCFKFLDLRALKVLFITYLNLTLSFVCKLRTRRDSSNRHHTSHNRKIIFIQTVKRRKK